MMHENNLITYDKFVSLKTLLFGFLFFFIDIPLGFTIDFTEYKTVYVITNRAVNDTNNELTYNHEVRESEEIDFLKVKIINKDTLSIEKLSSEQFLTQTTALKSNWLVFVHGDSKTFKKSVERGYSIQQYHKVNVIVFSWPSQHPEKVRLRNFFNSKKNVGKSEHHFLKVIHFLEKFKSRLNEDNRLSVLFHSLGNLYVKRLSMNEKSYAFKANIFDNVIINSAAVRQKNHWKWINRLKFQKNIFITSNKRDVSLKGVRFLTNSGKQLGEKVVYPLSENANYIQFTKAIGFQLPIGLTHTYFIGEITDGSDNVRAFYYTLFHGQNINFSEPRIKFTKNDIGYAIAY